MAETNNTMNGMTTALDLGNLEIVDGGIMTEDQRNRLISYTTLLKKNGISETDTIRGLSKIVTYGSSFPNVTLEELEELIRSVFEG